MERTGVGTVCLWILAVVFVVRGQNYVNVAIGKTYSQSTKHPAQGPSSNGANGNTGGSFSSSNCIHTNDTGEDNPWWEVDLGANYPVYNIDIWARTNSLSRVYPFTITVDGQQCTSKNSISSRHETVTCSSIMNGRKVRITRDSRGLAVLQRPLNLCEMQIWVCADGWYGQQCSAGCPPGCQSTKCDRQSGQCSPCKTAYTGSTCTDCVDKYYKTNSGTCNSCSINCLNQLCDKTTSKCNGCIAGRQGDQCSALCSTGCLNDVCQQSGQCSPCKDRWYGDKCSTSCPTGCLNACDQQSGKCSSCKDRWYGDQCSIPCPTGCLNACDQQSGKCSSCKDGWYGDQCSDRCPTGCLNDVCQRSGKCSSCKDGWYGDQCSHRCPTGCLNDTCQQSGQCSPCKTGYMGRSCSECRDGFYSNGSVCSRCSSYCRSMKCDKTKGTCNDCVDGRFGDTCTSGCQTANCRRCDQKTGTVCTECAQFLRPPACTDCLDNYYKQRDSAGCTRCTWSCKPGTVCDKNTGFCPACPADKQGVFCQLDRSTDDKDTPAIVGSVIGGAVIIGICIIIGILLKRRFVRSDKKRQNTTEFNEPDISMTSTSSTPGAPTARAQRSTAFKTEQSEVINYEIPENMAMATVDVCPETSTTSDIKYPQSEADSPNPYDELTVQYQNTGDIHLYDR